MDTYEIKNLEKLRSGLAECTVLLKRDGSFPLSRPGKIAVYGSGVRHTIKGGTGSGEVNSRSFVTVEEGLNNSGFEITTTKWLDGYDTILEKAHNQFVQDIKKEAKKQHTQAVFLGMGAVMPEPDYKLSLDGDGDTAVYVLARTSGEGTDRKIVAGDFLLSNTERRDILALNEKYENFMLVLNVGGPVDLTPVQHVKNIMILSQLGVETGNVLADILLGKVCPSGKLSSTWARAENYPDVGSFGEINDSDYREGIYVGYRWFEAAKREILFPFGYGLGYTDFSVSPMSVTVDGRKIFVHVSVKNTGNYSGKETVQIYLSCPQGYLDKPVKELAGFAKSRMLAPGEEETLTVSFDMNYAASFCEKRNAYILEKGKYTVHVGTSSNDTTPFVMLNLGKTVTVRQAKNLLRDPGFADWKPELVQDTYDIPEIPLDPRAFATETIDYSAQDTLEEKILPLNEKELCLMNMGAFDPKGGLSSVIGSASFAVAGAAGESVGAFQHLGIPSMVMADGPAGIRISQQYYEDKKGIHSFGPTLPKTLLPFMPKILQLIIGGTPKLPKGAELKSQYCTAIPIGTALAQSWNLDFARTCGDVVGSEMELFGIQLWLAPALNIHRSPLCGRNFEYYSEDPLISGAFAAAVTQGVQSHSGCGVTLKHYAANNQETNRYFTNSRVSQRAMREIYLKGFGLCIRKASPMGVMTSYNLLNGIHTSESRDLCTDILRREFGFTGVCMTDWVVAGLAPAKGSIYAVPDPAKVAAAGGDLFMPGSKADNKRMAAGLAAGKVTKKQLQTNASRVCRVANQLNNKGENI